MTGRARGRQTHLHSLATSLDDSRVDALLILLILHLPRERVALVRRQESGCIIPCPRHGRDGHVKIACTHAQHTAVHAQHTAVRKKGIRAQALLQMIYPA